MKCKIIEVLDLLMNSYTKIIKHCNQLEFSSNLKLLTGTTAYSFRKCDVHKYSLQPRQPAVIILSIHNYYNSGKTRCVPQPFKNFNNIFGQCSVHCIYSLFQNCILFTFEYGSIIAVYITFMLPCYDGTVRTCILSIRPS